MFFSDLLEKLQSLTELENQKYHFSLETACETLKRYLLDRKNLITVNNMMKKECSLIGLRINGLIFPTPTNEIIASKIKEIENITKPILHFIALGSYWSDTQYDSIWINIFKELNEIKINSNLTVWSNISNYTCYLYMYSCIISCLCSKKYALLYALLNQAKSYKQTFSDYDRVISYALTPEKTIESKILNDAFDNNYRVPLSERIYKVLREPLSEIITSNDEYDSMFDKAEFFFAVNYWYQRTIYSSYHTIEKSWAPTGRFRYKMYDYKVYQNLFDSELRQGDESDMIKAGFFGGSIEIFKKCSESLIRFANSLD